MAVLTVQGKIEILSKGAEILAPVLTPQATLQSESSFEAAGDWSFILDTLSVWSATT